MNFSALPAVAHAQSVPDPGGTGTGQNESREVKIGLDEIASMTAKTLGPTNDGDTLEASFDGTQPLTQTAIIPIRRIQSLRCIRLPLMNR